MHRRRQRPPLRAGVLSPGAHRLEQVGTLAAAPKQGTLGLRSGRLEAESEPEHLEVGGSATNVLEHPIRVPLDLPPKMAAKRQDARLLGGASEGLAVCGDDDPGLALDLFELADDCPALHVAERTVEQEIAGSLQVGVVTDDLAELAVFVPLAQRGDGAGDLAQLALDVHQVMLGGDDGEGLPDPEGGERGADAGEGDEGTVGNDAALPIDGDGAHAAVDGAHQ